jgi:hypothetical protein
LTVAAADVDVDSDDDDDGISAIKLLRPWHLDYTNIIYVPWNSRLMVFSTETDVRFGTIDTGARVSPTETMKDESLS